MEKKWQVFIIILLIIGAILLYEFATVSDIRTAITRNIPWTIILGCFISLYLLIYSGYLWYATNPWDISTEKPDGAFALMIYVFSLLVTIGLAVAMTRLNDTLEQGTIDNAGVIFCITILFPIMWMAVIIGFIFLLLPYFKPPQ